VSDFTKKSLLFLNREIKGSLTCYVTVGIADNSYHNNADLQQNG